VTGLTIGFSTSSPQASVAIFSGAGEVLWSGAELAPNAASGALVRLLEMGLCETGLSLSAASRFVADLGPGSFTGVRVGIVFAKVMAMSVPATVAGATAFDLIAADRTTFVPSRRGEVFVREPGQQPERSASPPAGALGYEYGKEGAFPHAANFATLLSQLDFMAPELLVPSYFAEPSISQPKQPYGASRG
jgi:tRNA A37 threonylcarbamoyladenosine modification protein TsaB